ncbi:MAG: GGDEF domain-containing protein [Stenotrophomonas sp.]|uniref:GGDEF domain-containing protein n=1 Tax=Stenotrophomonas sp. Y6 TaxID=2920383 RepID=UPI001D3D6839|nr:GGDEF domain-containing protein [Stenotrophomonas sp. Y6]MCH1907478.1 GGDEF domain-containing protein [Stenotrophomonas sp. Y6]MPS34699.1 GGDEF domain-containing protein [Stenotrophomonas sp.]
MPNTAPARADHDDNSLAADWRRNLVEAGPEATQVLAALAETDAAAMAVHFYQVMMGDPRASRLLSHEQVRTRLQPAMQRWVNGLLRATPDDVEGLIAAQRVIGDVHARVGIPVDLVTRGTRVLKQRLFQSIAALAGHGQVAHAAVASLTASFDIALEGMTLAYSNARERSSRTDAAYRLFSLVQNVGTERERQRALLLDWENTLLYALASQCDTAGFPSLAGSEFGLWFTHKGVPSFGESAETRQICELIGEIDNALQQTLRGENDPRVRAIQLQDIRSRVSQVRSLLGMLFERIGELDAGCDTLTNLLNRRFLPTVLRREIELAAKSQSSFAVLLLDLDHFKAINDEHGHEVGDRALQHVATILGQFTRGSDYVFRYGGEEFVVVLVAVDEPQALVIANSLCRRVAESPVALANGDALAITTSIGVAVHDGHPDYERVMARADAAMYQAKKRGRNRVVLADGSLPEAPGRIALQRG